MIFLIRTLFFCQISIINCHFFWIEYGLDITLLESPLWFGYCVVDSQSEVGVYLSCTLAAMSLILTKVLTETNNLLHNDPTYVKLRANTNSNSRKDLSRISPNSYPYIWFWWHQHLLCAIQLCVEILHKTKIRGTESSSWTFYVERPPSHPENHKIVCLPRTLVGISHNLEGITADFLVIGQNSTTGWNFRTLTNYLKTSRNTW